MNFLQKPVGVDENEASIMAYFKKTGLYVEINDYQVEKCLNGWWRVDTLTIGGYVHSTNMLFHFEYGKCDLLVGSPTASFLSSINLNKEDKYSRDFEYPFDKVVILDEPVNESDIISHLEKRYSETNFLIGRKYKDKVLIMQRDDSPAREWNECAYNDFCIAKIEANGMIKTIVLSPSPEMVEYCGFYSEEVLYV